jgi:hypothetical protein
MSKQTPSQANIRYASTPDAHPYIPYQLTNHTKSLTAIPAHLHTAKPSPTSPHELSPISVSICLFIHTRKWLRTCTNATEELVVAHRL